MVMSSPSIRPYVLAVLARPSVWLEALRAGWSARSREGWRALLPIPDPEYWAWRVHTADPDGEVSPEDVVAVLAWRRRQRRLAS